MHAEHLYHIEALPVSTFLNLLFITVTNKVLYLGSSTFQFCAMSAFGWNYISLYSRFLQALDSYWKHFSPHNTIGSRQLGGGKWDGVICFFDCPDNLPQSWYTEYFKIKKPRQTNKTTMLAKTRAIRDKKATFFIFQSSLFLSLQITFFTYLILLKLNFTFLIKTFWEKKNFNIYPLMLSLRCKEYHLYVLFLYLY